MKFRSILPLAPFLCLFLASCGEPDFRYLDGRDGALSDYDGRWLVVNFWAEWCGPCRDEIPALERFQAAHPDMAVLGISFDPLPPEELERIRKVWRVAYPLLRSEPAPRLGLDLPAGLPATWLRAPDGRWIGPLLGPQTERSLEAAVRAAQTERKE